MLDGDEELAQSVRVLLQTQQEEYFLDEDHGLSRENLQGKEANQDAAADDIIEAVAQEERIESVEDIVFEDNRKNRNRTVSLTLQKTDGETLMVEEVELDA